MKITVFCSAKLVKLGQKVLLFVLLMPLFVTAQDLDWYDYHLPEENVVAVKSEGELNSEFGYVHTPQGTLKVLLVFAQFEGDNFEVTNSNWKLDSLPNYPDIFYSTIDQFSDDNTDVSLSNYYYQMSKNSADPFKVIGITFPELIIVPQPTGTVDFGTLNGWVFNYIGTNYPKYKFSELDNRKNTPAFKSNNVNSVADTEIDYVVISYRWNNKQDPWSVGSITPTYILKTHPKNGATAVSSLLGTTSISTESGSFTFSSGYTAFEGLRDASSYSDLKVSGLA